MSDLYDRVVVRSREIRTDGYSMSIGEAISLYRDGDLEIHPEFQRIFRWQIEQRSSLIESVLLGIPIPQIFVAQRDDGVWDVIDGVQRLSTIFEFVGEYKDEDGELQPSSVLTKGEYLKELEGVSWDDSNEDAESYLDDRLRRDFKRAKLSFSIIKRESDPNAKFDLFQRLNAGSALSQQEARNCLLIMINRSAFHVMTSLLESRSFTDCIAISEQKENTAYKSELVLRFYAQMDFTGGQQQLTEEFGTYLTDWMKLRAERDSPIFDEATFQRTFDLLARTTGADTFRRFDGERHLGSFSISSFEFITAGVSYNIDYWEAASEGDLIRKLQNIWVEPSFRDNSGTGVSSRKRFPRMVNNGREYFASK